MNSTERARLPHHRVAYLPSAGPPDIDLDAAVKAVRAMPGKVVVCVWPEPEKFGSLYLVDSTKDEMKPDVGTVIASGVEDLKPGDFVVLKSQSGKCVEGFDTGSWWTPLEVRMYGRIGGMTFQETGEPAIAPQPIEFYRSVLCKYKDGSLIEPLGRNVLVEFDKAEEVTEGGIYLADDVKVRSSLVTVVSTGKRCEHGLKPGDKAWIHEGDVRLFGTDYGLVPEDAVYSVVN